MEVTNESSQIIFHTQVWLYKIYITHHFTWKPKTRVEHIISFSDLKCQKIRLTVAISEVRIGCLQLVYEPQVLEYIAGCI